MSDVAIRCEDIWKKFRTGELEDSLRDLIPALFRKYVLRRKNETSTWSDAEFWALREINFEVPAGKSFGVIGPNGAGKSTLLKLLSRIITPNRGKFEVNGRVSALIEVGAGFHPDLTGRENIYLNGAILGMPKKIIKQREEEILDFAGITGFADTPVKRYSSGMWARLGFAVAAHMEPQILLVDEVLSVGDQRFREKCIKHMHKLIRGDVTVVFISHMLDQVRALCPTSMVLDKGACVYNGDTDQAIRVYLDVCSENLGGTVEEGEELEAEVKNLVFLTPEGEEVLDWHADDPGIIEFDFVLHKPVEKPYVLVNFSTANGIYLGNAQTFKQVDLPSRPGTYRLRYTMDPMMLADAEYQVEMKIYDLARDELLLWSMKQPRMFSVKGSGVGTSILRCGGHWNMLATGAASLSQSA